MKEVVNMKKLISSVLAMCMFVISLNFTVLAEKNNIIISKPEKTVFDGLNSYESLLYNASDETVTVRMAVSADRYVTAKLPPLESKRLSIGFTGGEGQCIFTDDKTGAEYKSVDITAQENFEITYTNIENEIGIDDSIIFEFNSKINIDSENTELKQGSLNIDKTVTVEETENGYSRLVIQPNKVLFVNKEYTVYVPDMTDIFGRSISGKTYRFRTKSIDGQFEVLQKSSVKSKEGVGGFAILAEFENGNPQGVYFSRKTDAENNSYSPFKDTAIAVVTDPNGNIACTYDFSNQPTGTSSTVLEVPYSIDGIWQMKFISSKDGDVLEIGINGAANWGIRGEYMIGSENNISKTAYVYIPEKVDSLYVGTTDSAYPAKIYNENGEQIGITEQTSGLIESRKQIDDINEECVYKIEFAKNGKYGILVDIAPSLMCPTKEMALALKGGWQESGGVLVQGGLQARARSEILRIVNNKDLTVEYTAPKYDNRTFLIDGNPIENPRLEAYIATSRKLNVTYMIKQQNLDINSPFCGSFINESNTSFEKGSFVDPGNAQCNVFSSALVLKGQLNPFYRNKALADRTALWLLVYVVSMSEDLMIKDNRVSADGAITHGNFHYCWMSNAYMRVRDLLDNETVEILDMAMRHLAYKQGAMKGRGPTNQWFFTVNGVMASRYTTNDAIVKGIFERHLDAMSGYAAAGKGFSKGGYFIEHGCDGDYHNLSRELYYKVYKTVKQIEPNDKHLSAMKNIIQDNLEFISMFELPANGVQIYGTNAATSRKMNDMGCSTHNTFTLIFDEFPLAARKFELLDWLRTDKTIREELNKYANVYGWSQIKWRGEQKEYDAYKNGQTESESYPVEYENGIWEKDGTIAVKHKGLYMNVFYALAERYVPQMSFMGGGMSLLYGDNIGGVLSSRKPSGYEDITSYDQIMSSCMFGKKADGSLFMTGKETADFEWLIKNRKFKISGTTPDGINASWTYTLNSEGIRMSAETDANLKEIWLNIPLSCSDGSAEITHENGRLRYTYNDNSVEFTWDKDANYYVTRLTDDENSSMSFLRIKMNGGKCVVDIRNTTQEKADVSVMDFTLNEDINGVSVDVKNNSDSEKDITLIYAMYSEDKLLKGVIKQNTVLDIGEKKQLMSGSATAPDIIVTKVMVWDGTGANTYMEKIEICKTED